MKISLPPTWKRWIQAQVKRGEFANANDAVRAALHLLRQRQENRVRRQMRAAFGQVDRHNSPGEPTQKDLAAINRIIREVRNTYRRRE